MHIAWIFWYVKRTFLKCQLPANNWKWFRLKDAFVACQNRRSETQANYLWTQLEKIAILNNSLFAYPWNNVLSLFYCMTCGSVTLQKFLSKLCRSECSLSAVITQKCQCLVMQIIHSAYSYSSLWVAGLLYMVYLKI